MSHGRRIAVVGLGYVGLPVAVAFGRTGQPVVGFEIAPSRVAELKAGFDRTLETNADDLAQAKIMFTTDPSALDAADFFIVTVPTPIDDANRPDMRLVLAASRAVAKALKKGDIVVYESTFYPGATEEDCIPLLERESGLTCGLDFTVGYSPERINPGDRERRLETIAKVVAGQDDATLEIIAEVYGSIVAAGVYRAPSIKVAEAAKVIENTQRDLNIALMNELAIIFSLLDVDTADVLATAGTKWNFLHFTPGLVGGHCIGVDPYYLTHRAERAGYHPQVILAGRRINDQMGAWIARECIKRLLRNGGGRSVTVLGLGYKENVPDIRNSKVIDVIRELNSFGVAVQVADPLADPADCMREYDVALTPYAELEPADAVILAVAHADYVKAAWGGIAKLLKPGANLVLDVKAVLDRATKPPHVELWRA
ncbi:nucleotide sugar dehydrogenase [Phreatobacter stygius]|uniref:Nucleotide sugar dehydrogenase n=1 Tax=Phreatobacter stygius TaxID=1940610 RepID=A0A4D7B1S5_9HYPH|nr:nucleotide sugar dehydrogenase [Phreatobacter stygius]QCI63466.1 nucleotide sugar dehydrogenase [Phreatobacter stygius]